MAKEARVFVCVYCCYADSSIFVIFVIRKVKTNKNYEKCKFNTIKT